MADADVETRACELARGLGKRGPALFSPTPSTRDDEDADAARRDGDRAKKILSLVRVLLTAKKVKEDAEPAEILPGVFLGSIGAAHNEDALRRHRITHVLTVASSFAPRFPDAYEYLVVDVADAPSENLRAHFERCLKFIARARLDGGNVLVHCFAGRSRSATIVAAYAMATEGTSLEETMRAMKEKRPTAGPNRGFAAQLRAFERELTERRRDGRLLGRLQLDALAAAGGGGGKEGEGEEEGSRREEASSERAAEGGAGKDDATTTTTTEAEAAAAEARPTSATTRNVRPRSR